MERNARTNGMMTAAIDAAARADLTAGRLLVAPLPTITVSRKGYVALVPFDADKTSSLTGFIEWLKAEGAR